MDKTTIQAATETAQTLAAEHELRAKIWHAGTRTRVYLSRTLARGRTQPVGHIEIDTDSDGEGTVEVTWSATRIRSTVSDIADAMTARMEG